jgi:hypothetical protein
MMSIYVSPTVLSWAIKFKTLLVVPVFSWKEKVREERDLGQER